MIPVRRLLEADAAALRAVRLQGLAENPEDFGAAYEDEAAWPLSRTLETIRTLRWFGAEQDARLVGCVSLRVPEGAKLRHNGWINAMYVVPPARGAGAADALLDALETEARVTGVTWCKLVCREDNNQARRFYERCGYEAFGREPDSIVVAGRGYVGLEMAKRLA